MVDSKSPELKHFRLFCLEVTHQKGTTLDFLFVRSLARVVLKLDKYLDFFRPSSGLILALAPRQLIGRALCEHIFEKYRKCRTLRFFLHISKTFGEI